MMELPCLDTKTYQKILEESIGCIPAITSRWTDFNPQDTGILILEMMAGLTEQLNYMLDQAGDEFLRPYLNLLYGGRELEGSLQEVCRRFARDFSAGFPFPNQPSPCLFKRREGKAGNFPGSRPPFPRGTASFFGIYAAPLFIRDEAGNFPSPENKSKGNFTSPAESPYTARFIAAEYCQDNRKRFAAKSLGNAIG